MLLRKLILQAFLWSFLLLNACTLSSQDHKRGIPEPLSPAKEVTIYIQPFTDLPATYLNYVSIEFQKTFKKVMINPRVDLPARAFFRPRNRYRADSLLSFLNPLTPKGCHTLGLTTKDISTTKGNALDWGVMGLGNCPGKSCVASSFRLKGNKMEKLYKVAIHELGHTEGLPHCNVKTCYMRDAEGHDSTDEETGFCADCKKKLIQAGWHFK